MPTPSLQEFLNAGKPIVVYDAGCSFCRRWVARTQPFTRDAVLFRSIGEAKQQLSPEQCAACAQALHLFMPDGSTLRGAHAVLYVWGLGGRFRWLLWAYEHVPGAAALADAVYSFIAAHRT